MCLLLQAQQSAWEISGDSRIWLRNMEGGIFLLVYLILTVSFGYVLIMSETALGRMTRKSPVGAFQTFGKTKSFKIGGWLNAINPYADRAVL